MHLCLQALHRWVHGTPLDVCEIAVSALFVLLPVAVPEIVKCSESGIGVSVLPVARTLSDPESSMSK